MLASIYIDLLSRRAHAAPVGRALVSGINHAAAALDGRSSQLREIRSGALIANFHVVADA
jgi:hypothetical protein